MDYYKLAWIIMVIQAEWLDHVRSMTKAEFASIDFLHWLDVYSQLEDARIACLDQIILSIEDIDSNL